MVDDREGNGSSDSQHENPSECIDANILNAYVEGSLSEEEQRPVDSHIRDCQICREVVNLSVKAAQADDTSSQTRDDTLSQLKQRLMPFNQLSIGETIGRYIILKPLGLGGMGEVYLAYDPELNRRIALKLLRTDAFADSNINSHINRLLMEAQAMARLSHPNVNSVYDVLKLDNQVIIAMEYLSGGTLKSWLNESPRSWREIVEAFVSAGQGLAAAHVAKLIHRDFKPANILLGEDGRVCVTDFGLVRTLDQVELPKQLESLAPGKRWEGSLTKTGAFMGTPIYMSPEQLLGEKIDTRSDQFGFCVALFEALYGLRPFAGSDIEDLKESILDGRISPVDPANKVPAWVYDIIKRGLEVKPENRYASMKEMLHALTHDPTARRRKRWMSAALAALVLFVATGIFVFASQPSRLCKGAEKQLEGIWDGPTKQRVKKAFLASDRSYAGDTFEKVEKHIDEWTQGWVAHNTEACEATHFEGKQSAEILDLRMTCLRRKLDSLKSLMEVFGRQADEQVVESAIKATLGLGSVAFCADVSALKQEVLPPEDPGIRKTVEALQLRLEDVRSLDKLGKYREAKGILAEMRSRVEQLNYPPLRTELAYFTGLNLERLGNHEEAIVPLREALQLGLQWNQRILATKAVHALVHVLGTMLHRFDEALTYAVMAQGLSRGIGKQSEARSLNRLASVLQEQGKYEEAEALHRRALTIQEKELGPEHLDVADSTNALAISHYYTGRFRDAEALFNRTLVLREKVLGSEHPLVAGSIDSLAIILDQQGKYKEAEALHRRALTLRRKALGSEHQEVADSINNLAISQVYQGKFQEAEALFRRAIVLRERALGPEHPKVAKWKINLAHTIAKLGKYQEAEALLRRALTLCEKALGYEHRLVANALVGIGEVLRNTKKYAEAKGYYQRALSICEKKTCDQLDVALGMFGMARILWKEGKNKHQAIQLAKQARNCFVKVNMKKDVAEVDKWIKERS